MARIDDKETYDKNGILIVQRNQICCYLCSNYKFTVECTIHGILENVVSKKCDEYDTIVFEDY